METSITTVILLTEKDGSIMLPSTILRWQAARTMWDAGYSYAEIAAVYGLSTTAFRVRVQKFRREQGWFPPRTPSAAAAAAAAAKATATILVAITVTVL